MHIDIVDVLRCLTPHEDTWLVASIDSWSGRHILAGTLSCPVCHAVYTVSAGVADFSGEQAGPAAKGASRSSTGRPGHSTAGIPGQEMAARKVALDCLSRSPYAAGRRLMSDFPVHFPNDPLATDCQKLLGATSS